MSIFALIYYQRGNKIIISWLQGTVILLLLFCEDAARVYDWFRPRSDPGGDSVLCFLLSLLVNIIIFCSGHLGYSGRHLLCHLLLFFFILEPLGLPLKYDLTEKTITWSVCVFTEIKRERERGRKRERRSKWKVNKAGDEGRVNDKYRLQVIIVVACVCASTHMSVHTE